MPTVVNELFKYVLVTVPVAPIVLKIAQFPTDSLVTARRQRISASVETRVSRRTRGLCMEDNLLHGYVNETLFWAKVKKTETCWYWTSGARTNHGAGQEYGLVNVRVMSPRGPAHRTEGAHRISYELANGPIPTGLYVLHSCDHGLCLNPTHLHLGTHEENMNEKVARDRHPRGGHTPGVSLPRESLPTHSGERHWFAKLTDAQVVEMREAYAAGGETMHGLARRYGVAVLTVRRILLMQSRKAAGGPRSEIRPIVGGLVHNAKMTPDKVVEMRQRFAAGETIYELGAAFGISAQTAGQIIRRENWKHVLDGAPIPPRPTHRKLTREQVTNWDGLMPAGFTGNWRGALS